MSTAKRKNSNGQIRAALQKNELNIYQLLSQSRTSNQQGAMLSPKFMEPTKIEGQTSQSWLQFLTCQSLVCQYTPETELEQQPVIKYADKNLSLNANCGFDATFKKNNESPLNFLDNKQSRNDRREFSFKIPAPVIQQNQDSSCFDEKKHLQDSRNQQSENIHLLLPTNQLNGQMPQKFHFKSSNNNGAIQGKNIELDCQNKKSDEDVKFSSLQQDNSFLQNSFMSPRSAISALSSMRRKDYRWGYSDCSKKNSALMSHPISSIQLKFKIECIKEVLCFGDVYNIITEEHDNQFLNLIGDSNPNQRERQKDEISQVNQKQFQLNEGSMNKKQLVLYSINKSKCTKTERKFFLKQASQLMSITRHSGFSALSHMFMSNNLWFFIFDKTSDITLAEYIMRREKLPDLEFIQNIALDLFKSLQMLHSQDIVHLDLNLNNIVVDEQQIQLNDFNQSGAKQPEEILLSGGAPILVANQNQNEYFLQITNFLMSSGIERKNFRSNKISSLYFMAPERILAETDMTDLQVMAKCDTWSVGIILFFLFFGDFPFQGENTNKLVRQIKSAKLKSIDQSLFSSDVSNLFDLIEHLLEPSVDKRLDAAQALNHKFLTSEIRKNSKIKQQVLQNMKKNWKLVALKDQIINYESFLTNAKAVTELLSKVFCDADYKPTTIVDIENGISSITEDLQIAKFIVKECSLTDLIQKNDLNGVGKIEQKIDAENISANYLNFYQEIFKKQLMHEISYFSDQNDRKKAIQEVRTCLQFILKKNPLEPDLDNLEFETLLKVLVENQRSD